MSLPAVTLRIAFASDPMSDSPSWTDVSSDLISFSTKRGRQNQLDRMQPGRASFVLDNSSGNYWPDNTGGDYTPNVKLRKRVNFRATNGVTTYDLYTGFITGFTPGWQVKENLTVPVMTIECQGLLGILARPKINTSYAEQASGTRVGNVFTSAGWNATERDIDAGKETLQASTLVNESALAHLQKVQESELSVLWEKGDGYLVYDQRGTWDDNASQATFGHGELPVWDPVLSLDDELLYNEIRLTRTGGAEQVESDQDYIDDYGLCTLSRSGLLLTNDVITYVVCLFLLARYKDAKMRAKSLTIKPQESANEASLWPKVLGYEIGTKITLALTGTGISGDYFIEGIEHSLDYRKGEWIMKWQLSDASQLFFDPGAQDITLRPTANAGPNDCTPIGDTANWQCVDDVTSDGDTTYVKTHDGLTCEDRFTIADLPTIDAVINSVTLHVVWRIIAGSTPNNLLVLEIGGNDYNSDPYTISNAAYAEQTFEWATNPATGLAWTISDINSLVAGFRVIDSGGNTIRVTQLYATVNVTPAW